MIITSHRGNKRIVDDAGHGWLNKIIVSNSWIVEKEGSTFDNIKLDDSTDEDGKYV